MTTPKLLEGARQGAHFFDTGGRRYLDADCSAGIFNLGRRRPELAEALKRAARAADQGNFPIISEEKALLAEALAHFVPGPLECSLYGVTRGEAFDAACKVARGFTKRPGLAALEGAWHGETGFALSLSQRADRDLYGPLIPETALLPFGDLAAAERAVTNTTAAVFLEPVQAENGCRAVTPEYARGLADLCRARGALLVVDETQTNFGRTGARFAFERLGVEPDILILGEALGGGMFPITVTLLTQRVNGFMNDHPLIHLSTFGGSDVACLVAREALGLYAAEKPWENAATMGKCLRAALDGLVERFPALLSGVAGEGLLLALRTPSPETARALCAACLENGLLVAAGRAARDTVVIRPSLLVTEAETDELASSLEAALRAVSSGA
ncbi:MAG TPA: aspartate aminotransferase family protein [Candidatus Hydrogenedentes bacterium]|nr:aspartate aminotransferase family protein [Candidatus Hydrogenedentota bacterium]